MATLEERVSALERIVQKLLETNGRDGGFKDWRAILTLPPPPNIQVSMEIDAAGQAIRERERRAARRIRKRRPAKK
jgi:hypothetical protein